MQANEIQLQQNYYPLLELYFTNEKKMIQHFDPFQNQSISLHTFLAKSILKAISTRL